MPLEYDPSMKGSVAKGVGLACELLETFIIKHFQDLLVKAFKET